MLHLTNEEQRAYSLCNLPLFFENVPIYPVKVGRIVTIGEGKYNYYLSLLFSIKSLLNIEELDAENIKEADPFDLIFSLCIMSPGFLTEMMTATNFFLDQYFVRFDMEQQCFNIHREDDIVGKIDKENFKMFCDIIKMQNYLYKPEEEVEENPADEEVRKLLAQRRKARERVEAAKRRQDRGDERLSFADYLSIAIAHTSNIKCEDLLDMTVYAFFDLLQRLALIDNYDISIKQVLAGADPNKVKIKHWFGKLER